MAPRKTIRRKRAPVRRRAPARKKTSLVKAIKSVMKKSSETKMAIYETAPFFPNPNIVNASQWNKVLPLVLQAGSLPFGGGTIQVANNNSRVGNSIQPTSCRITIHTSVSNLYPSCYVVPTIYVFKVRGLTNYTQVSSLGANQQPNQFLDKGNGDTMAYGGFPTDRFYPVNDSNFTLIHKKSFILSKGYGRPENDGSGNTTPGAGSTPQGGNYSNTTTFNIPLPASLKYSEDATVFTDDYPNNCAIWWAIGFANGTQSEENYPNGGPITTTAVTTMYFKDM